MRLRGNVVNDKGEIVAGMRFRHQPIKPDQTIRTIDAVGKRVQTDNGVRITTFVGPCADGISQCRHSNAPVRIENVWQAEYHPLKVGFIREGGRDLSEVDVRARSMRSGLAP
ncbi:protein of unknown function [Pararobbsia alpina]